MAAEKMYKRPSSSHNENPYTRDLNASLPKYRQDLVGLRPLPDKTYRPNPSLLATERVDVWQGFDKWFRQELCLRTIGYEKREGYKKIECSWAELRNMKEPTGSFELDVVGCSTKVVDSEGTPLVVFIEDGLNLPFTDRYRMKNDPDYSPPHMEEDVLQAVISHFIDYPPEPSSKDRRDPLFVRDEAETLGLGVHCLGMRQESGVYYQDSGPFEHQVVRGARLTVDTYADQRVRQPISTRDCVQRLYLALAPMFQAVGMLYERVDPDNYYRYLDRYTECANASGLNQLRTSSRCCFLMAALISGQAALPDIDDTDVEDGWAAYMSFGEFSGGHLQFPHLGIEFDLKPGAVCFVRSRLLYHSVSDIQPVAAGEGGCITRYKRYSIVLYSQAGMIDTDREWVATAPQREARKVEVERVAAARAAMGCKLEKRVDELTAQSEKSWSQYDMAYQARVECTTRENALLREIGDVDREVKRVTRLSEQGLKRCRADGDVFDGYEGDSKSRKKR